LWLLVALLCLLGGRTAQAQVYYTDDFPGGSFLNTIDPVNDNVGGLGPLSNIGFIKQPNEPVHAGNAGGSSGWMSWQAPATGPYTFTVTGSFNSILAIYTGNGFGGPGLTPIVSANAAGNNETVTLNALAGVTYRIAVDGNNTGVATNTGIFNFTWSGPPRNNDIANATVLGVVSAGQTNGNNINATAEVGEPAPFGSVSHTVWYSWVAPISGTVSFATLGSGYDTELAVYRLNALPAVFGNLTLMGSNDDIDPFTLDSRVTFVAVAGTRYFFAIDGFGGASGFHQLIWSLPPPNDDFANATVIVGTSGITNTTTAGATFELNEPVHTISNTGGASVWYKWTAPTSGKVNFTTAGSNFDTVMAVYTGTALNNLLLVVRDDDGLPNQLSTVSFNAVAGTVYYIAVDGNDFGIGAGTGTLVLNWLYTTSAGQFRFAADTSVMSEQESVVNAINFSDNSGVAVTVTRENGTQGRMLVDVIAVDGTALRPTHYLPPAVTNTLVFDDFQMSASLIVRPVFALTGDKTFSLILTNPRPDPVTSLVTGYTEDQTLVPLLGTVQTNIVTVKDTDYATPRFARQHYTVSEGSVRNIQVYRGIAGTAWGAFIRINGSAGPAFPDGNTWVLTPGSDYAQPDTGAPIDPDFSPFGGSFQSGTVTWAANEAGNYKTISLSTIQDTLVEFNEDIKLFLHDAVTSGNPLLDTAILTIMFDDQPPGAVDRLHNRDNFNLTDPPFNTSPGANGPVFSAAVQADGKAVIAGDFTAYNTQTRLRVARMNLDGSIDTTFDPGNGADSFASVILVQPDQKLLVGGGFFSFNSVPNQGITRLLTSGAVDPSFNPGTGANAPVRSMALYTNAGADINKIIVVGEFTQFNGTNINYLARLKTDGSLDAPSFGIGSGPNGPVYAVAISGTGKVVIGGDFTEYNGVPRNHIARLNSDGSLDLNFNPGGGTDGIVNAVVIQPDDKVIVGGQFSQADLRSSRGIARFNSDGTLDTTFYVGSGFNDAVFSLALQPDGRVLTGGIFTTYHGTRRVGMARLLTNGSLDTGFMDTAYNQFAGVVTRLSTEPKNFITTMALQANGNIIVGGSFLRIGGGFLRDDIHPRSNVARVIGGNCDGPGNIEFTKSNYTIDENAGNLFVTVTRTNGSLGAGFTIFNTSDRPAGPGQAVAGTDYRNTSAKPTWPSIKGNNATPRRITEALMGPNNNSFAGFPNAGVLKPSVTEDLNIAIFDNSTVEGDRVLDMNLGLTSEVQITTLGGESIPFGVALGADQASLTIVDNDFNRGVLGFANTEYSVTENGGNATITVVRTNGSTGSVTIDYSISNGTATGGNSVAAGVDYLFRSGRLTFPSGVNTATFTIPIVNDSLAEPDETVILSLGNPAGGASTNATILPITATLKILDNDFAPGKMSFNPSSYTVNESDGSVTLTVVRTGGNVGAISVLYRTVESGLAQAGSDFTPTNNGVLTWNDGDTAPKTITIPILQDGQPEGTQDFTVVLEQGKILATGVVDPLLIGTSTATVNILDSDPIGSLQLVSSTFSVSENGGQAIITVERVNGSSGTAIFDYATAFGLGARPVYRIDAITNVDDTAHTILVRDHGLANGNIIRFETGSVPNNLSVGVPYFVVNRTQHDFQVSLTAGGAPILITGFGVVGNTAEFKLMIGFDPMTAVDVTPDFISLPNNPYANGDQVIFNSNTPGSLPGGLTAGTTYYVVNRTANSFQVANAQGGAALPITTGSIAGTTTVINDDEAGYYHAAGQLSMAGGITSQSFTVDLVDNKLQNKLLNGSFNRNFSVSIFNIGIGVGAPTAATVTIVDDEFINEPAGGLDQAYNSLAGANGFVYALSLQSDGSLLAGGDFTTFNGLSRPRIVRLFTNGNLDDQFLPGSGADAAVRVIEVQSDKKILLGGFFTNYNGTNRSRIARINFDGSIDLGFNPGAGADNPVYNIKLHKDSVNLGKMIVAGAFTKFNGQSRPHLVRLNTNGAIDTLFSTGSGPDGDVYAVAIQTDGKIIIGGDFLNYNGQPATRLARLLPNGTLDTTFNAQANGSVRSLLVQKDGRILVGGFFTLLDGQSLNYLARLQANGSVDALFNVPPGGDRPVLSIALQPDGKILAGGDFQLFSGVTRNRITRLNADGSADAMINFGSGADTFVSAIVVQPSDGKLVIGGGFTTFDGQPRNYLARLHGGVIAGPGKIQFEAPLFTVQENQTNAIIVLRRIGGTTGSISVDMSTSDIVPPGPGNAVAGVDYSLLLTNVVFPHAETFKQIRITIADDSEIEGDEYLNLSLQIPVAPPIPFELGNQPVAQLKIVDDDSAVFFSQGVFTVSENDPTGAAQIQLIRTGGISGTLTVRLTTSDGTATAPSDYTAVNGLLTFLPGETNKTIAVPIVNDTIDEGNESLNLTLTKVSGGGIVGTQGTAILNIINDDFNPGLIQFSQAAYSVDENGGSIVLTVVRTNGSSGLVTVNFATVSTGDAVGGVTAAPGVDFILTNGSLTFADGEKVKTVTVRILQDAISTETNETFQVQLSNATGGAVLGFPNPATVTIINNNSAIFGQFSILDPGPLLESGTYPITVNLAGRTTNQTVTVDYTVVGVSAQAGADFVATNGTLTFINGVANQNIMLTVLPDNLVETNETLQVILSNASPNNGPSIVIPVRDVTIVSTNQLPGTVVFRQPVFTGTEDSLKIEFVLERTNGVTGNISVDVNLLPGTAGLGVDYQDFASPPLIVTWADGDNTPKTNSITLINDTLVEADETIGIVLSNPGGNAVIGTTNAVAVIVDDEIKAGSVDTAFAPTFDGPVYGLTIWPATNRITAVGDFHILNALSRSNVAQVNLDGTLFTGFNPGVVTLAGGNASIRSVLTYTNGTNIGKVIIGGRFDSVNGTSVTNIARLNIDGTVDTSFNIGTGPNAPVNALVLQADGRVIIGGDFNTVNGTTVNFLARLNPNGSIDTNFVSGAGADSPVNALLLLGNGDIVAGGDFNLFGGQASAKLARLSTTGALIGSFSTNLGTGFNNSVFALVAQQNTILVGGAFTSLNNTGRAYIASLNLDGTSDTLTFTNSGAGFNDSVFALAVQPDGQILAAGNFTEFNNISHNRIVRLNQNGSIDTTINFGTGADGFINAIVLQPDNKILIAGGFQHVDGQLHPSLARLNNGTNQGSGVFQFSMSDFPVNENDSSVGIVVSRIIGTALSASVDVITLPGTATSPLHYQAATNTLVFAEGETTKELRISIFDDVPAVTNANRIFYVELHNPTNNVGVAPVSDVTLLGTRTNSSVTIVDNESVISFAAGSFVVAENGGSAQIVLTRTGGSNDPVSVQFQTFAGTTTAGFDYQETTNIVSWASGDLVPKIIFIPIVNDVFVEGIETVNLQLSSFTGSGLPGLTNAVLNVIDDDFSSGVIGFELANYNVTESQAAQITLVRTNGSSGIVSVQLTSSNITALAGSDYLGTNILVTFANGESRKVVNIATKDDLIQDDGETFLLHLSNPTGGAVLGLADTIVTIDDNDVTIGFTTNSVHVTENNATLQLTLTRSGLLNRTFIIDYATANGTAQAGLDYIQTNGVVVFGPNETNKTLSVQILSDFIIEGAETFTLSVSGTNLSLIGNTTTTVTIDDNDLATDLEVLVSVNNPVKTNSVVQYSLLVTNYGPSDISGVILTNLLPASLQIQSISVTNVSTNGNALIFDLPLLPKGSGYTVVINALDTNGVIRSVTNVASLGLPSVTNDLNLANNIVTNVTKLRGPGAYVGVDSLTLTSETPGPANGAFDVGEQVTVSVTFRNLGDVATTAATASLIGTGGVVTNVGPQNVTLGALAPNGTATRSFTFLVSGTNGGSLVATFNLADTGAVTYDPAILRYRLGGSSSFGTTNGIVINDNSSATPYPATLNVAGLVGVVDQVSLTLSNVYHTFPADIDILLVSPSGQSALVMSDALGSAGLTNKTFTITDLAAADLPISGVVIANNSSYRPKDYFNPTPGDDAFAAPAPVGPYFTSMAAFKGIDPNGLWQLYVRDDSTGDFGIISNGWSLNISTVFPANATAGLVVSGTQSAGPVLVGADLTYTIIVTNHGPSTVGSAFLTNLFSSPFTVVTATNTVGGAATLPSGRVILALGAMTNGATVTNVVTVHPTTSSTFTNLVTVGIASGETDPFLGDNSIIFSQIVGANADLAVSVATSPAGPVALGNNLTYTVSLTNLGPSTATSVVLTNILPANVNYVSGSASQGVVARSGSQVTATLGSLAANGSAQLTITVTPMVSGSLTNTVTASSAVNDSNPLNNQAVATTTAVTDSADLKISLVGSPSPVTLGSNITYTITVTNLGPSTASGVVVTNPLPSAVTLVSFTNNQGSAANVSGAVVFTLGSVPTGTNVTMQVVVTANTAGAVNSTAIVAASGTFDPVTGNNSATTTIAVQSLSADIDVGAALLLSESIAPANGALDPGETVTVRLELANKGAAATANLVATLLPTGGVTTNSGPQVKTYGAIASGSSASQDYTFKANGNLGDTLSATLQLQDGATSLGTVTFTFQLGETVRGGSGTAIVGVDVGPALTYPSIVNISGVSGTILKATVTLTNVTHTFPDDFDILLVSPTGKKVILMSDAGGGFAISGINITFDDSAASFLPDNGQITDGVYRPSNYLNSPVDSTSTNDVFAAPAPAGPYGSTLADFVGENPNGDWKLYVVDDQTGNVGTVGGWSLSLVTVSTLAPSADVAVAVSATPNPVGVRSNLTYTVTVTNRGPNSVSGVTVTNTLPPSATLVSLATAQGTIGTNATGQIVWTIGSMAANAQYQALIVAAPQIPGSATNATTVAHTDIELNNANNSATVITTVSGFVLSGGSVNPSPSNVSLMLLGQPNVTYTIEASTDLVNWTVIGTSTTNASGIITINDPAGSAGGLRFYRAHQ